MQSVVSGERSSTLLFAPVLTYSLPFASSVCKFVHGPQYTLRRSHGDFQYHETTSRLFEVGFAIPEVAFLTGHGDWKIDLISWWHEPSAAIARSLYQIPTPQSEGRTHG